MELLTTTLVIVLLTTVSAKPIGRHYDADIADNDGTQGWLEGNNRLSWQFAESSSYKDSSSESDSSESDSSESDSSSESESSESESSESESSESESSEEEVVVTDQTTPVMTTTPAMTTITTGDGSTLTPEPDTVNTDETTVTMTPPPATSTTPAVVTSPGNVTHCVTEEIPTAPPITENRGDN